MTYSPLNTISSYLPLEFEIPNDFKEMQELIAKRERLTSSIVNIKENGSYDTQELLTAQQWFSITPPAQQKQMRYTFRKVVNFGAMPNATTKSVAHGIQGITGSWIFTRIFGCTANPTTMQFLPLPYLNGAAPMDSIGLFADATNVNITTSSATWIGWTQCYVVLEYIKQ